MNRAEYAAFETAFAHALDGLTAPSSGACSGCDECREDYDYNKRTDEFECIAEPSFSKSWCEVCGNTLAGNRYPIHGLVPSNNTMRHLEACDDCVYYLEYGQLDDQTMDAMTP